MQAKAKPMIELMQKIHKSRTPEEKINKKHAKDFINCQINFLEIGKKIDLSPLVVYESTPLAKVHFIFSMMSPYQVYVVDKGLVTGIITVHDFMRKNKIGS